MSSLQRRIAAVTDTTANLIAQLRELDRLRTQVRKALLSARKSPQPIRRNSAIPRSHRKSTDHEPAFGRGGTPEAAAAAHRQAALGVGLDSANKTRRREWAGVAKFAHQAAPDSVCLHGERAKGGGNWIEALA